MCCRTSVISVPREWRDILLIAGFRVNSTHWSREISPGIFVSADENVNKGFPIQIDFSLHPSIAGHSIEDHRVNASSAAIMWKTCMTLAERSRGTITQHALVGDCQVENGGPSRILAHYPDEPLRFENLCMNFQIILLGGVGQEPTS